MKDQFDMGALSEIQPCKVSFSQKVDTPSPTAMLEPLSIQTAFENFAILSGQNIPRSKRIGIPEDVGKFIFKNPETVIVFKLQESIEDELKKRQIEAETDIKVVKDVDVPEMDELVEELVIEFKIKGKPYDEVLQLWDEVAQICNDYKPSSLSKIELVLSSE